MERSPPILFIITPEFNIGQRGYLKDFFQRVIYCTLRNGDENSGYLLERCCITRCNCQDCVTFLLKTLFNFNDLTRDRVFLRALVACAVSHMKLVNHFSFRMPMILCYFFLDKKPIVCWIAIDCDDWNLEEEDGMLDPSISWQVRPLAENIYLFVIVLAQLEGRLRLAL